MEYGEVQLVPKWKFTCLCACGVNMWKAEVDKGIFNHSTPFLGLLIELGWYSPNGLAWLASQVQGFYLSACLVQSCLYCTILFEGGGIKHRSSCLQALNLWSYPPSTNLFLWCACVCMCVCICTDRYLWSPEENIRSLGAGITDRCEPSDIYNSRCALTIKQSPGLICAKNTTF